jgi:hypothetical protein
MERWWESRPPRQTKPSIRLCDTLASQTTSQRRSCSCHRMLVAQNGGVDFGLVKFLLPARQERLEEMIPADLPEMRYTTPGVQRVHPDGSVTRMLGSDIVLGAPNDIVVALDNSVTFSDTGTSWRNGAPQPVGTAGIYRYRPPGTDAEPSSPAMVEAFGRAPDIRQLTDVLRARPGHP